MDLILKETKAIVSSPAGFLLAVVIALMLVTLGVVAVTS